MSCAILRTEVNRACRVRPRRNPVLGRKSRSTRLRALCPLVKQSVSLLRQEAIPIHQPDPYGISDWLVVLILAANGPHG